MGRVGAATRASGQLVAPRVSGVADGPPDLVVIAAHQCVLWSVQNGDSGSARMMMQEA